LLAAIVIPAGCSSATPNQYGEGPVKLPVRGHSLNVGGVAAPIVNTVPSYCGCLLVLTASGGYKVYRYVGPGSPGPKLVAVRPKG
jgi:hypothetical protein